MSMKSLSSRILRLVYKYGAPFLPYHDSYYVILIVAKCKYGTLYPKTKTLQSVSVALYASSLQFLGLNNLQDVILYLLVVCFLILFRVFDILRNVTKFMVLCFMILRYPSCLVLASFRSDTRKMEEKITVLYSVADLAVLFLVSYSADVKSRRRNLSSYINNRLLFISYREMSQVTICLGKQKTMTSSARNSHIHVYKNITN